MARRTFIDGAGRLLYSAIDPPAAVIADILALPGAVEIDAAAAGQPPNGQIWNGNAWQDPPPTPHDEAAALLAGGLQITSASNPALNGTYPMDREAERRILGLKVGGLPKGAQSVPYAELDGTVHMFSKAEIDALSDAMRDFAFDVEQTLGLKLAEQPAEWPAQPVAID